MLLLLTSWSQPMGVAAGSGVSAPRIYDPFRVSTISGSKSGWRDGIASNALFYQPSSIAVDPVGRIWIAESVIIGTYTPGIGAHRVRRIDPESGLVVTVAGNWAPGNTDGPGDEARFSGPSGFAFDKRGNVYVSDRLNHRIRKIGTNGVVTTFAGSGPGLRDGAASTARFHLPIGLAMDNEENLYIADFGNHRIRKISSSGMVTTVAGSIAGFRDGVHYSARFNGPTGLAVTGDGTLIVGDWVNGALRKVSKEGVVTTLASDLGFVQQVKASSSSTLYVIHSRPESGGRNTITRFNSEGADEWEFAPAEGDLDGVAGGYAFSRALGDLACLEEGKLLIADTLNDQLRLLELTPRANLLLSPSSGLFTNQLTITALADIPGAEVRLTFDGAEPAATSRLYTRPLVFDEAVVVKARVFVEGYPRSMVEERRFARVYALDDGLLPGWREAFFGAGYVTDPRVSAQADPDADGYSNLQEFAGRTDPTDPRSFPFEQKKPLDFNGDGEPDMLLQNEDGFLAAWFMRGEQVVNASSFDPPTTSDPGLLLVGVGDFNQDQKPDLMFQHRTGVRSGLLMVWIMDGVRLVRSANLEEEAAEPGWNAAGVGDYNFDGWPDVIGQSADGVMSVKFCRGTDVIGLSRFQPEAALGSSGQIDLSWRLVGNADVNGDGRMDLLFQREGGLSRPMAVWFMNGLSQTRASLLQPSDPGPGWSLAATGDFNKDGKPDFLFQHTAGSYGIWYMNDVNRWRSSPLSPETAGPGWRIAGPR